MQKYDIAPHMVYCHHSREVVRIPVPEVGRVVVLLDGSGVEGQPTKAGVAAVEVSGVGQETEVIVYKGVYGATSHGEAETVANVVLGGYEKQRRKCGWRWTLPPSGGLPPTRYMRP